MDCKEVWNCIALFASLFDDWKDRSPISIAEWVGNCACDDYDEENDEAMSNDFDDDGLAATILCQNVCTLERNFCL